MNPGVPTAADLRARILGAVQREPSPPRAERSRRRALFIALGFSGTLLMAALRYVLDRTHGDLATAQREARWHVVSAQGVPHRPWQYVLSLVFVWSLVVIPATWAGIARGPSMLGRSGGTKLFVAALTPLALLVSWLGVAQAQLQTLDELPTIRLHLHCTLMSIAFAVGPLLAFFAVRQGTDPTEPRWGGAAIGAVAGTWGALVYFGFCECTSPVHIALSHVLPVGLLALLGAVAGKRVLGFRT